MAHQKREKEKLIKRNGKKALEIGHDEERRETGENKLNHIKRYGMDTVVKKMNYSTVWLYLSANGVIVEIAIL